MLYKKNRMPENLYKVALYYIERNRNKAEDNGGIQMETKRKKRLMNAVMVILILIIAACGVFVAGSIRGWFDTGTESWITSGHVSGVVSIERNGIGYSLQDGRGIKAGDVIETKQGSTATLQLGESNTMVLNENTELTVTSADADAVELSVGKGEVFADLPKAGKSFTLKLDEHEAKISDSVFSASVQMGSMTFDVYMGEDDVTTSDGTSETVASGERLQVSEGEDGKVSASVQKIAAEAMNEFAIVQAQKCDSKNELCFSVAELQKVLDDRAAEKQAALEASLNSEKITLDATKKAEEFRQESESETEASADDSAQEEDGQPDASGSDLTADGNSVEEYTSQEDNSSSQGGADTYSDVLECTIEIRCDTILDNMENLTAGKEAYVPANGCILSTSTVEFEKGETVYDVLSRVCSYAGIQMESSWTPLYNSYYVEGINNLYEFDCGNQSGWMYKVNGWFPNYGASSYYLEDGDTIVWTYTCNGLGADVGGGMG